MAEPASGGGTVGKALDLLDRVASAGRPLRFSELLAEGRYPKATLYRLLQTLTDQGMLSFDLVDHAYRPGLRLVRLAHAAWAQSSLAPIARPYLDALSRDLRETVHLAQLDSGHVLYIDKRNAAQPIEMFSQAGKVGPAYCTGIGKAMLAYLEPGALEEALRRQAFTRFTPTTLTDAASLREELCRIREAGVSWDREEHEPGIICVAVPIRTGTGRVIGGLSVTSSTDRHGIKDLEAMVPALGRTAAAIGEEAQVWLFPAAPRPAEDTRQAQGRRRA